MIRTVFLQVSGDLVLVNCACYHLIVIYVELELEVESADPLVDLGE